MSLYAKIACDLPRDPKMIMAGASGNTRTVHSPPQTSDPGAALTAPGLTPLRRSDVMPECIPVDPFDACDYMGADPRNPNVAPLTDFPDDDRIWIGIQVQQPHPPEKWLHFKVGRFESRAWFEWHWYRGIYPLASTPQRRIRGAQRRRIIERDGEVCGLCGGSVEPHDIEIDHIIPVVRGGTDEDDNLQVAHSRCNRSKGGRI